MLAHVKSKDILQTMFTMHTRCGNNSSGIEGFVLRVLEMVTRGTRDSLRI